MALGYLFIMFVSMAIISGLLIGLLYFIKNEKVKNILFYILLFWSILVAFINVTSLPSNYISQRVLGITIGILALVGTFIKFKNPNKVNIAYLLVSISTLLSLLDLYI